MAGQGPLAGLKILDLSSEGPGPFCTMLLADLGADVIVVDRPHGALDETEPLSRGIPIHWMDPLLRSKRRIGLNLKTDGSRAVIHRLASSADVVIVQMRPGKPESLGVGYADLNALNERLIYCMISGYGMSGPMRDQAGHDLNYLGVSGVLSLFGRRASPPPAPPNIIADYGAAGMMAVVAVLAAVEARHTTGRGQHIDLSMTDASSYLMAEWISTTLDTRADPDVLADYPPYDVYACSDGKLLTLGCVETRFWSNLCVAIEREELFGLAADRATHSQLRDELRAVFASKTREQWMARFQTFDLPVAVVNHVSELPSDPQLLSRHMIIEVETDQGPALQVGLPVKLSETDCSLPRPGVRSGADSEELLRELGFRPGEVEHLREAGVVFG